MLYDSKASCTPVDILGVVCSFALQINFMVYIAVPILSAAARLFPTFRDMFEAGLDENKRCDVDDARQAAAISCSIFSVFASPRPPRVCWWLLCRFWENEEKREQPRMESIVDAVTVVTYVSSGKSCGTAFSVSFALSRHREHYFTTVFSIELSAGLLSFESEEWLSPGYKRV